MYTQQTIPSGCCISYGVFHERCVGRKDLDGCKTACDADENCKGYVQVGFRRGPCQIATTSRCPRGFGKHNVGNVGELDSRAICHLPSNAATYGGCFIKQLGKLPNNVCP